MDPRERVENLNLVVRSALQGLQNRMWTALPAFVVSYDATKQTVAVQPTIAPWVTNVTTFTSTPLPMPVIPDCPVVFPGGGGFTLTFPIQPGDECLLVISTLCIDPWWQYGGLEPQTDPRRHDLSDCFAFIGPKSLPNVLSGVSTSAVQLRSDDGSKYVEIDSTAVKLVNGSSSIAVKAAEIDIVSALVSINGYNFDLHQHSGVVAGGDDTGPVA